MKRQDFEKQGVLSGSFETNLKYFGQLTFTAPLVMYQSPKKFCSELRNGMMMVRVVVIIAV